MRPSNRTCPVCRKNYTGTTATCSSACRAKASRRKRTGQPIANPYNPQEVEEILTELHQLRAENQRLRTGQKRTKDWKAEATKTQAKLATAQNRLAPYSEQNQILKEENRQLTRKLKNAGRLIYRLQTSLGAPSTLISDYMHFARWYYNHKPSREWDEHNQASYTQTTHHHKTTRTKPPNHYPRTPTTTKLDNREKQQARMPNTVWASAP